MNFGNYLILPILNVLTCLPVPVKSLQSCLTLCDPMDCSPPGSSIQGILQARILDWVVMHSSRGSSPSRDWTQVCCSSCNASGFFTTKPPGKPVLTYMIKKIISTLQGFVIISVDNLCKKFYHNFWNLFCVQ